MSETNYLQRPEVSNSMLGKLDKMMKRFNNYKSQGKLEFV